MSRVRADTGEKVSKHTVAKLEVYTMYTFNLVVLVASEVSTV